MPHRFRISALAIAMLGLGRFAEADDPFSAFSGESFLSLGFGYSENIFLSEIAPVDAAFTLVSLEAAGGRSVAGDSLSWDSMLFGEKRFFEALPSDRDQSMLLVQSELTGYAGLYSKWVVGGRYLSLKQAFDATFDIQEPTNFLIDAQEPKVYLGWESFVGKYEYALELGASEMSFEQSNADYQSLNWELEASRSLGDSIRWTSQLFGYERRYDQRLARDRDGAPFEATLLKLDQVGFKTGLAYELAMGSLEQQFELMFTFDDRADAHSGYYDRGHRSVDLNWRGVGERLIVSATVGYAEYRYRHRHAEDGSRLESDSWSWHVEGEKPLSESWAVFGFAEGELESSNDTFSSYETRSVALGMRWYPYK